MIFSKFDRKIIATAMEQFGCNERESAVYLQVLQMGASSVQQIARRLQSNRITVHSAIEQLIEKGLLFESLDGVRRKIEAQPPSIFARLAAEKALSIKTLEHSADELQKLLSQIIPKNVGAQKLELYEGIDSYKRMLMRTLEAKGEFLAVINTQLFTELLGRSFLLNFLRNDLKKEFTRDSSCPLSSS